MESEETQRRLFTFKRYTSHRALVTNLALTPEAVYRFYCDRAAQELLLREFKYAAALSHIPSRSFWAHAAFLEFVLWAYDLVLAFQHRCLPTAYQRWNLATRRRELWWLPAEWVTRGHRNDLLLPARYPHPALLAHLQKAITKVRPLI